MTRILTALQEAWYRRRSWSSLLLPLSWIFQALRGVRNLCYRVGFLPMERVGVPVVVVGNITVGGTGKSPVTVALAKKLEKEGFRPGVVSRGYGGVKAKVSRRVTGASDAALVGDEAVMMAKQLDGLPVVVDSNRPRGARYLVKLGCDCVISDDGLQHLRLARDMEVVVVDGSRGFGNGKLLPAGPLREPVNRLQRVDYILVNDTTELQERLREEVAVLGRPHDTFKLSACGLVNYRTGEQKSLSALQGARVSAVAGIGHPERFFETLRSLGAEVHGLARRDHDPRPFRELPENERDFIVTTAKDAVKWRDGDPDIWVLHVDAVLPEQFVNSVIKVIQRGNSTNS